MDGVTPAKYFPFIDFNNNTQLSKFGLINGGPGNGTGLLNEKWESIAVLPTFRKKDEFFIISAKYYQYLMGNANRPVIMISLPRMDFTILARHRTRMGVD